MMSEVKKTGARVPAFYRLAENDVAKQFRIRSGFADPAFSAENRAARLVSFGNGTRARLC